MILKRHPPDLLYKQSEDVLRAITAYAQGADAYSIISYVSKDGYKNSPSSTGVRASVPPSNCLYGGKGREKL